MKQGSSKYRIAIAGCLIGCFPIVCVLLIAAGGVWLLLSSDVSLNKPSAISCVCEWARLAPLPVPNSEVNVETKGGMFSREFIVTFKAEAKDASAWLHASPSTRE
jgi:hypothetical protein